ncbi:MAG: hypothetical protein KF752_11790 [Pirellulaceae bacterium]|nr:hypothetical protein [Pirellulaceae bacterium]
MGQTGDTPGTLLSVTDANGIVGFGFQIEHAGQTQLSVAWPDRPAERFTSEMIELRGITVAVARMVGDESVGEVAGDELYGDSSGNNGGELLPPVALSSFSGLSPKALKYLNDGGLQTIEDVRQYIKAHGSLIPLGGIGEKMNHDIREALGLVLAVD